MRCIAASLRQGLFELHNLELGEALSYLSSVLKLMVGMVDGSIKSSMTGEVLTTLNFFL